MPLALLIFFRRFEMGGSRHRGVYDVAQALLALLLVVFVISVGVVSGIRLVGLVAVSSCP